MSVLLIIPERAKVEPALRAAELLLDYTGRRTGARLADLVGIWRRDELDRDLPCLRPPHSLADEPALGLERSVSLSGLWAVVWFGGTALEHLPDPQSQRLALLEGLVAADTAEAPGARCFLPVLTPAEARLDALPHLAELDRRFPGLIGRPRLAESSSQRFQAQAN